MKRVTSQQLFSGLFQAFLFFLPIQTIWIYREIVLEGAKWEYGTLGFYATQGLLWLSVTTFMYWYWQKRGEKATKFAWTTDRKFVLAVLIFLLYGLAHTFLTIDPALARQYMLHSIEAVLIFIMISLGPVTLWQGIRAVLFGTVLQAGLGLWQFIFQSTFSSTLLGMSSYIIDEPGTSVVASETIGRWLRAYGGFSHPNVFGGYLVLALLLSFFSKIKNVWVIRISQLTITAGIVVSFSRSSWIAFVIGVAGLFAISIGKESMNKSRVGQLGLITMVFIAVIGMTFPLVQTRVFGGTRLETTSIEERVNGYQDTLSQIQDHPWLGVGPGQATTIQIQQHPGKPGWAYQPVHNVPLLILLEFGVIGILLLSIAAIYFFKMSQFGKKQWQLICMFTLPLMPLLLFDHYLYTSYVGLMIWAVYLGYSMRYISSTR